MKVVLRYLNNTLFEDICLGIAGDVTKYSKPLQLLLLEFCPLLLRVFVLGIAEPSSLSE